ncbi:MAG: PilZ domain-containing protein [Deltaproteobacteria bacterium]|nr:PilZ domain-containing protein [Deltaproteobacteria bacterium]
MKFLSNDDQDRRKELRFKAKTAVPFNVLESANLYIRTYSSMSSIFKQPEYRQELNEHDPLEAFLLQLDAKLNYMIDLLSANIQRKEYAYQGLLIDISASGIHFLHSGELEPGTPLEIGLALPAQPNSLMDIAGEVLRCEVYDKGDAHEYKYEIGLVLTDILPDDQENIVRYIFQKQREEIRHQKNVF